MRARHRTLTLRLTLALTAVCAGLFIAQPAARADDATSSNPEVRVNTNMGSFVVELYPDRAPLTVADFLRYVKEGFYTNTLFHRVVANFVIQGGGHDANPPYALKPTYPSIDNESGNGLQNKRGSVGLARAAGPHTGSSTRCPPGGATRYSARWYREWTSSTVSASSRRAPSGLSRPTHH